MPAKRIAVLARVMLAAALLGPLMLSACEPSPVALVGLTGSGSSLSFATYTCKGEPRVVATIHEGSQPLFALQGRLPDKRYRLVSMVPVNAGWTVSKGRFLLLPGHAYTLELSDGEGLWLGASVDFTTSDLQKISHGILLNHYGKRKIVDQKGFVGAAEQLC